MSKRKKLCLWGMVFFSILSITWNMTLPAHAKETINLPAPPNNGPSMQGNFNVVGKNLPNQVYDKYSNVQVITDGSQNSKQAMWWKNKINVTKPFTIRFYAFITATDLKNVADGITFTLQNDKKKQNYAIGTQGESMGAYGNTRSNNYYGGDYVANALSYEFDPYYNGDYSDSDLTDKAGHYIDGQHTAFTTTSSEGIRALMGQDGFRQVHFDARSLTDWPNIFQPKWHKFVYNWQPNGPNTAEATVNIDDSSIKQSYKVNLNKIFKLDKDNPYVWWGFTGSTGEHTMISAIAATAVSGDPGLTKLAVDLSHLSEDEKKQIKTNINNSSQSDVTKQKLWECVNNPNAASADPDLSNMLVSLIPDEDFTSTVTGANVGDVILYKISIYNYQTASGAGQDWRNVTVSDDKLDQLGMTTLDNQTHIAATYDVIHPIDITSNAEPRPSSVGFRTVINNGNMKNPRSNVVTTDGHNVYSSNIQGNTANMSSVANVYVNPTTQPIKARVVVDNHLQDVSKNHSTTNNTNTLTDVATGDTIQYDINLKNIVQGSKTTAGEYSFWVPSLSKDDKPDISLNNTAISDQKRDDQPYYQISDDYPDKDNVGHSINTDSENKNKKLITIYNVPSLDDQNAVNISAKVKLGGFSADTFASTPVFHAGTNDYYVGNEEDYNFDKGSISFNYIGDIDYGIKDDFYLNQLLSPERIFNPQTNKYTDVTDKDYIIAQINDSRRAKRPYSVYLSQLVPDDTATNAIGTDDSPFILHYVKAGKDSPISPNSAPVKVYDSAGNHDDQDTVDNIYWNNDNELKIGNNSQFTNHKYSANGKSSLYNAKLNWTIKDNDTP